MTWVAEHLHAWNGTITAVNQAGGLLSGDFDDDTQFAGIPWLQQVATPIPGQRVTLLDRGQTPEINSVEKFVALPHATEEVIAYPLNHWEVLLQPNSGRQLTWQQMRAATYGSSLHSMVETMDPTVYALNGDYRSSNKLYRGFIRMDFTGLIPSGARVAQAEFHVRLSYYGGDPVTAIVAGTQGSSASVWDFGNCGSARMTTEDLDAFGDNVVTLNQAGVDHLNAAIIAGVNPRFAFRLAFDLEGTTPNMTQKICSVDAGYNPYTQAYYGNAPHLVMTLTG
ncbi:MAG: hypothetical protein Q7W30_07760 [Coriobacteriia bacterium]|nr:hypothetical protein [Coriobacteriia bacterium]